MAMATIDSRGQITIKRPKSLQDAIDLIDEIRALHDNAVKEYEADPSAQNSMKLNHAIRQLDRAIGFAKPFTR